MRRRLLDLCLLAYPRSCRKRDRDYLRDLAVQLSETYGWRPQAISLVRCGLRERVEVRRLRRGAGLSTWTKRVVVAGLVLASVTFAASSLTGHVAGAGERVEVDRFACADTKGGGADAQSRVASRRRAGWDCAKREGRRGGQSRVWQCTLRQAFVIRSSL